MKIDQIWPRSWSHQTQTITIGERIHAITIGSDADPNMANRPQTTVSLGYSINLYLKGKGTLKDAEGVQHAFGPGYIVERWPNVPQEIKMDDQTRYEKVYIYIDISLFQIWKASGLIKCTSPVYQLKNPEVFSRQLYDFYQIMAQKGGWNSIRANLEWAKMMTILSKQRKHPIVLPVEDSLVTASQTLCWDRQARLSIQEVAKRVGLNYHSFRKKFQQRYGLSPAQYRQRNRMLLACEMLSTLSVQEVSEILGFCSPFDFSSRFRKDIGVPPSHYHCT